MIRHAEIPVVNPGDPLSASLINQLIRGANSARFVTSDGSLDINNVSGLLGISDPKMPLPPDSTVLVSIKFDEVIGRGGFYFGSMYNSPAVSLQYNADNTEPFLKGGPMECIVFNLKEIESKGGILQGVQDTIVVGKLVGTAYKRNNNRELTNVYPLVVIDTTPANGFFPAIVKRNGTDGSGNPTYDVYHAWDTSFTFPLNTTPLTPTLSRARWQTALTVTAAADGSDAVAYKSITRIVKLLDCAEKVPVGACTSPQLALTTSTSER